MKNQARAWRRHHVERLKDRWRSRKAERVRGAPPEAAARVIGIHVTTGAVCSCWMCGNPRRYTGEISRQERRWRDAT